MHRERSSLTWVQFKEHLARELTDRNPNHVYDALSCFNYQLETDPMEFVTQLKCKFAVLGMKGDDSKVLDVDKIIKTKMISSLPKSSRERLELFKAKGISLERFMERFTQERTIALALGASEVRQVSESEAVGAKPSSAPTDDRLAELERKMERLNKNGFRGRMTRRANYCPYCRSGTHGGLECTKNPRPGSCFDCLILNCWRGKTNCPGRVNNTR